MADNFIDQLIAKFSLDLTPVKQAAGEIQSTLNKLNDLATQTKATATSAASTQKQQMDQLKQAAQAGVVAAKAANAIQIDEIKKKLTEDLAAKKLEVEEEKKKTVLELDDIKRVEAAQAAAHKTHMQQLQLETAELRKKKAEGGGEKKETSALGGLRSGVAKALFGGGLGGAIAGGVIAGTGLTAILESAAHAVESFVEKLKELTIEAGKLNQVESVFRGLAKGAGVDASAMLDKMRASTEGLVDKLTLLKVGVAALGNNFKLNHTQIEQAVGDIVRLAEAHGKEAGPAIQRFSHMLETGRINARGLGIGIQQAELQLKNLPPIMDPVTKKGLEMAHAFSIIHKRAEEMGELPATVEQMMTRLRVSWTDLLLSFGRGIQASPAMQVFIDIMKQLSAEFTKSEGTAEQMGKEFGNVFLVIGIGVKTAIVVVKELSSAISDLFTLITSVFSDKKSTQALSEGADEATRKFREMHPELVSILAITLSISSVFKGLAKDISGAIKDLKEIADNPIFKALLALTIARLAPVAALGGGLVATGFKQGAFKEEGKTPPVTGQEPGRYKGPPTTKEEGIHILTSSQKGWLERKAEELSKKYPSLGKPQQPGIFDSTRQLPPLPAPPEAPKVATSPFVPRKDQGPSAKFAPPKTEADELNDIIRSIIDKTKLIEEAANKVIKPESEEQQVPLQRQTKLAALQMKGKQEAAKIALQEQKNQIEFEKEQNEAAYRDGIKAFDDYQQAKRDLQKRSYQAQQTEQAASLDAQLKDLQFNHKLGMTDEATYQQQRKNAILSYSKQLLTDTAQNQRALYQIEQEGDKQRRVAALKELSYRLQDQKAANEEAIKEAQRALGIQEDAIKAGQRLSTKKFSAGDITPDQYFQQYVDSENKLTQLQITNAQTVYAHKVAIATAEIQEAKARQAAEPKNLETQLVEQEKIKKARQSVVDAAKAANDQILKSSQSTEEAITLFTESEIDKRLKYIEQRYSDLQKALETQISIQQSPQLGAEKFQIPTADLIDAAIQKQVAYREQLVQLANSPEVQKHSQDWYKIVDSIEQAYQKELKYREELAKLPDILGLVAQGLNTVAQGIGQVFGSKFAQNLSQQLTRATDSVAKNQDRARILGLPGGKSITPQKSPEQIKLEQEATGIFTAAKTGAQQLVSPFNSLTTAVQAVTTSFQALSGQLNAKAGESGTEGSGETSTEGTGTPEGETDNSSGEMTTSTSSASAGMTVFATKLKAGIGALVDFVTALTGSKSAITGVLSGGMAGASLGSMFGPIGTGVGAGVGALVGGITGQKNAQVTQNITHLQEQFKDIMNDFEVNTNNLSNTIDRLNSLMQQAKQMQANSKKGGAQYQQVIDQYSQQLIQLSNQQQQTMIDLREQLAVLQAPFGTQDYMNSLEDILKQYDKFVGAAQNARDLADANKYLTDSLQAYELNLDSSLRQANEQAINDAIQLNDLLYQRQQFINQLNTQVANVLTQGNLTRQLTTAQSKAQQVYQIQFDAQRQLDVMNEQIASTQYRVNLEGQIFNLATTRVGLETQLLQLQNAQTNQDMARIDALAQLVSALKTGDLSILQGLLSALPGTTNPNLGPLDLTGIMEQLISAAYVDRSSLGYGTFRAQGIV